MKLSQTSFISFFIIHYITILCYEEDTYINPFSNNIHLFFMPKTEPQDSIGGDSYQFL